MAEQFENPPRAGQPAQPPESADAAAATQGRATTTTAAAKGGAPPVPSLSSSRPIRRDSGFEVQLKRAKLADLVQLECLSGAREAVAILSEGRRGHLFFEGGAVVHARTATQVGNAAALEILSWTRGTFGQSPLPWPGHHTITLTWQELLIQSGQTSEGSRISTNPDPRVSDPELNAPTLTHNPVPTDEARPAESSVAGAGSDSRTARATSAVRRSYVESKANWGRPQPSTSVKPALPARRPSTRPKSAALPALLLDRTGSVIARQGDTTRLEVNAHSLQVALDGLGEALGLNAFSSFECTLPERKMIMFRNTNGGTVAVETPVGAKLKEVRASLER